MYFIPLSQVESVELVIHALRSAGGQADCSTCPARRVCMQQCLTIATAVEQMLARNELPNLDPENAPAVPPPEREPPPAVPPAGGHLRRIK